MLTSHYTVQHTEASLHWTCLFRLAAAIKLCVLLLVQSGATFTPAALLVWETISAALIEEESVDRAPPCWQQVYRLLSPVALGYIGVQHQHRLHLAESENPQYSAVQCLKLRSQSPAAIFSEQSNAVTVYTPALLTIFHHCMSICGGHVEHLTEQPSFHIEREPAGVSAPAYVAIKKLFILQISHILVKLFVFFVSPTINWTNALVALSSDFVQTIIAPR